MIVKSRTLAILAGVLCILTTSRVRAAVNSVGGLGSATEFSESGLTLVDLARPATGPDTYGAATVYWAAGSSSCAGLFMLKFYRPDEVTGENLTFVTQRGPFSISAGLNDYVLSPPVPLNGGDLVGITELVSGECGAVQLIAGGGNETLLFFGDSGTSNITLCDQSFATLIPQTIGLIARSQGTDSRAGVVLGAGSVQGASDSNFKTSMQLLNPGSFTIQGFLIFHPLGQPGAPTDPSMPYSLAPGQVLSFPDIVAAIGTSGLGSIDVIATSSYGPLVVTRIFDDKGTGGTAGFSEPLVRPGDEFVIDSGHSAWLLAPSDFTKFRMNIALRSLADGATLNIRAYGPDGSILGSVNKSYPGDEFDLEPPELLIPGITLPANAVLKFEVTSGRAIVGAVTVDNKTNDTGLQLGTRVHF